MGKRRLGGLEASGALVALGLLVCGGCQAHGGMSASYNPYPPPKAVRPIPRPEPAGYEPVPPPPTTPTPVPPASPATPATPGSPLVVPTREPMPVVPMPPRGTAPYPRKELPAGKRLGRGGVMAPGIPSPDRIAIASWDARDTRGGKILDARTGAATAILPGEPGFVAPAAGVVVLEKVRGDKKPPRLVRLSDGVVVTPKLEAGGRPIREAFLAAHRTHDKAIAFAETEAGEKLAGVLTGDFTTIELRPAPFPPASATIDATLNAPTWELTSLPSRTIGNRSGTPFPLVRAPANEACIRATMADDGTMRCLEYTPQASSSAARWLSGGYFAFGTAIGHVDAGPKLVPMFPGDKDPYRCQRRGESVSPPRAIATCHRSTEAVVWAPGRLLTFQGPADSNDISGLIGADSGPVLPIPDGAHEGFDSKPRSSTRWIDLNGLRIVTTPSFRPLPVASFRGVPLRALAEEKRGKQSEVWLLDFEAGSRDLVATVTDCPGELEQLEPEGSGVHPRRIVLTCTTPFSARVGPRQLFWSEVVDLEQHVRYRTTLLPEIVFDDGLVVLSARRVLVGETKNAITELISVDLARP